MDKSAPRTARETVALALPMGRTQSSVFLSLCAFSAARMRAAGRAESAWNASGHKLGCACFVVGPREARRCDVARC